MVGAGRDRGLQDLRQACDSIAAYEASQNALESATERRAAIPKPRVTTNSSIGHLASATASKFGFGTSNLICVKCSSLCGNATEQLPLSRPTNPRSPPFARRSRVSNSGPPPRQALRCVLLLATAAEADLRRYLRARRVRMADAELRARHGHLDRVGSEVSVTAVKAIKVTTLVAVVRTVKTATRVTIETASQTTIKTAIPTTVKTASSTTIKMAILTAVMTTVMTAIQAAIRMTPMRAVFTATTASPVSPEPDDVGRPIAAASPDPRTSSGLDPKLPA
ncbi:hypothetical protein PHYPSEUDO_011187 [Phytophthora pseudosyringae]|uniref:Uncharacterized protein n=1 Tax=Phytophthora pseudosyringae TaxID=221518 RepID=A0A8T1VBM9_9STRA|nr:hypothetical protein PHYPSEUDO_011187 [Phytophthora pseudosyringae]